MTIERHNNETQTRWDHGEFGAMILSPENSTPIGFCAGTPSDEEEIIATATEEGVEVVIDKKRLKTGREIWTVRPTGEI